MSDAYFGEIRLFAGSYAPQNWHICDGSLLQIQQYQALFTLLGTTYGGNGTTDFALPDLRGRVPVGMGQGPSLTNRVIGQKSGTSTVTVTQAQMPAHTHAFNASSTTATAQTLTNGAGLASSQSLPTGQVAYYAPNSLVTDSKVQASMAANAISSAPGGGGPHNNLMPYLTINYIICTNGLFPNLQ